MALKTADALESLQSSSMNSLLAQGYPSLFEFLVKEIGYSPSSAQRRIDGARLLNQVSEISAKLVEKIETGSLKLSQINDARMILSTTLPQASMAELITHLSVS